MAQKTMLGEVNFSLRIFYLFRDDEDVGAKKPPSVVLHSK